MRVALRRDLRQVGDAQYLAFRTQRPQFLADDLRDRATNAGIDLVEHHRRHRVQSQGRHFDGQRYPRQFAARGDLAQGPWRLAGVGRDQELDTLAALGIGTISGTGVIGLDCDLETTTAHAELGNQGRCRLRQG